MCELARKLSKVRGQKLTWLTSEIEVKVPVSLARELGARKLSKVRGQKLTKYGVPVSLARELGARKLSKVRGQKLTWLTRVRS